MFKFNNKKKFREFIYFLIRISALPLLVRQFIQRNTVTILTFHNIRYETAQLLFHFIRRNYKPISLKSYIQCLYDKIPDLLPSRALIVTLDDGYKENFILTELLKKTGIVPTVFLCSDMPDTNKDYWFRTIGNRRISNDLKKISNSDRLAAMKDLDPQAESAGQGRVVLNRNEIMEMMPYTDFQSHTQSHPVLTKCTDEEVIDEVAGSKKVLKEKFGLDIYALAYPNGSFGDREMKILKEQGYLCGLGLNYGLNTILSNPFSLSRIPLNDNAGINEIVVKSSGLYDFFVKWLFPVKKYL